MGKCHTRTPEYSLGYAHATEDLEPKIAALEAERDKFKRGVENLQRDHATLTSDYLLLKTILATRDELIGELVAALEPFARAATTYRDESLGPLPCSDELLEYFDRAEMALARARALLGQGEKEDGDAKQT